ncbi:phasin family protein [Massilia aurea]|uniref:phasin family protein n=1 Tax=Massilia aurea TaxID=373040 RepID=UPI0034635333
MPSFSESVPPNPALQAQLDAQAGMIATLSQRNVDLLARVSELNMQMARQALETALDTGRQLAACTDPLQLSAVAMRGWQPLGEHVRNYQQNMMGMLAEAQAGLANAPMFAADMAQPTARKPQ